MQKGRIVVAPQAFKGRLTARQAASRIAEKLCADETVEIAIADGGDGTLEVVARSVNATLMEAEAMDAQGSTRPVFWGYEEATGTAIIEVAQICGWDPSAHSASGSTSYGLGQVIIAALDYGVSAVIIGVGGSGTNDAGAGMAQALGFRLLDADGLSIGRGGEALSKLKEIDKTRADPRLEKVSFIAACDVQNPLLGPQGATCIYAAQKGADAAEQERLESALSHFSHLAGQEIGSMAFGGAGGGIAAGAHVFLNATLCSGAEMILDLIGFDEQIAGAEIVITGEGRFDAQTGFGKGPYVVAKRARAMGKRPIAVVGQIAPDADLSLFDGVYTLEGSWPHEVHNL